MTLSFQLLKQHKLARSGIVSTAHGFIHTPVFMPVGTRGTIKAMLPESVASIGAEIVLGNTYHLMLRPGADRIERLGGLHKFMNWPGPILTDSGGFQVMSLANLCKVSEAGVEFRSHIDGSKYMLTPELSTQIQQQLGSTISMALDQCLAYPSELKQAELSMQLTSRWAARSRDAFLRREGYGQFGIVQGGIYRELREQSAYDLQHLDFEGYAIGGLAVGEGHEVMLQVLDYSLSLLPQNKPRYLMGVGKPIDIIEAVRRGVDMFDCVIPTRSGRNGQAYTRIGTINIRNSQYAERDEPLDSGCMCYVCQNYSMAYLHHVTKVKEIIGAMLMTWHNIHYFQDLMYRIRTYIHAGQDFDFIA